MTGSPLAVAIDFAKRGFAVLPVGANKRPWTPHGVRSASSDPAVFTAFDWGRGAACAVATGAASGVDVLDIDVRPSLPRTRGGQESPPPACLSLDGFATLSALGIDIGDTLKASTPNAGLHLWFKHIEGSRSRTLGPGVEWFSTGKYVVVPPAPGRAWINDAPIAEAPDVLKRLVLAKATHHTGREDFSGPRVTGWVSSSGKRIMSQVPKPIYLLILRLMPKASAADQRRVRGLWLVVALKQSGRNNALNYSAFAFRELIDAGAITVSGAATLLYEACKANGYLAKDGEEAVRLTIVSGLGSERCI